MTKRHEKGLWAGDALATGRSKISCRQAGGTTRALQLIPRIHLSLRKAVIPMHSSSPPLLSKLDEQASGGKGDDGDQRKSQHDILQFDSCNPRCQCEDKDGRDDVACERYTDNGICNNLSAN